MWWWWWWSWCPWGRLATAELGILPYSGLPPHLSGLVTGLGFFGIGALPLVAYSQPLSSLALVSGFYGHSFGLLLAVAAVVLFVLGGIKVLRPASWPWGVAGPASGSGADSHARGDDTRHMCTCTTTTTTT